jgi:hypothetical protein
MVSRDYADSEQARDACPRCGDGRMRVWYELTEDEREVVTRLPASADATLEERAARRRWCTRCWHEETGAEEREA